MFAVIATGGKQYKVFKGDLIEVESLNIKEGSNVIFDKIFFYSKGNKVGTPWVNGVVVKGKIVSNFRDRKLMVYKYKRRKKSRVKKGHRQDLSRVEIKSIGAKVGT